jgi:hypothetical protein
VGIAVKGVMTVAFGLMGRALFVYAGALKGMPGATAALGEIQPRCWRRSIWLAVLYTAGELTGAIVEAMR